MVTVIIFTRLDIIDLGIIYSCYQIQKFKKGMFIMSNELNGGTSEVKELNSGNFKKEVLESSSLVLVDFFATWCMPCKMMSPVVDQIAWDFSGELITGKLDIDKSPDIAQEYEVMSVPTFIFFLNGKLVQRETGAIPKDKLVDIIEKNISLVKS